MWHVCDEEKCIQCFGGKNLREEEALEDLRVEGRIMWTGFILLRIAKRGVLLR
jgi:hypothetical protein